MLLKVSGFITSYHEFLYLDIQAPPTFYVFANRGLFASSRLLPLGRRDKRLLFGLWGKSVISHHFGLARIGFI